MSVEAQVGVVILTHGPSGADMVATLARLLGPEAVEGFVAVEVRIGEPKVEVNADLTAAVRAADRGAGVLVCCDLHGSTPANCAVDMMRARLPHVDIAVISGVSMPMLMKLATTRRAGAAPADLAKAAVDTAIRSIRVEGPQPPAPVKVVMGGAVASALAKLGVPTIDLESFAIAADVLALVPAEVARRHRLMPISRAATTLIVAMVDPSDRGVIGDLEISTHHHIEPVIATEATIDEAIRRHYEKAPAATEAVAGEEALHDG
jgi:mannose/fructose-specific phosphotransferase system component IIA